MELNITNQANRPIIVFASKLLYTQKQLLDIIQPKDILKKAGYDYYWKKNNQESINSYFSNYVRSKTGSTLQFLGRCQGQGDSVHMINVKEIPDWAYIFYLEYEGERDTCLFYSMIPLKSIFAYNDTYVVSVYNINFAFGPPSLDQQNDEVNQILDVEYSSQPVKLSTFEMDWQPKVETQQKEPIIFVGVVFLMIIVVIVVLICSFFVIYQIGKNVVYQVSKNTTVINQQKEVPKLYLD